ncbi:MAG TPA: c-type cytochrome biogenesis protein CcmI [Methylocystis sp.]|nr:c-type cytochrome biogenesis protein CcmI [Methylocystis sp.]
MIWLIFALLSGAAVLAVLIPLAWRTTPPEAAGSDKAFYREQIAEIVRERTEGRLDAEDAEAARAEAARRLLRAAETSGTRQAASRKARLVAALATLVLVPALAVPLYLKLGAVDMPDMPLAQRQAASPPRFDLAAAVEKIEQHLAEHPDDGRAWEVLAPVYVKAQRFDEGVRAYSEALRLLGATPARHAALGEAYVLQSEGMVIPAARRNFEAALALDPKDAHAGYYMGLAAEQDGDRAKAVEIWKRLLEEAPPQAGYRALLRQQIERLTGEAFADAPSTEAGKSVASLAPGEQQAMIGRMVDRLAARLAQNGADVEGWLKLIRAYSVMAEPEKAAAALAKARQALHEKPAELAKVEELAQELGVGKEIVR